MVIKYLNNGFDPRCLPDKNGAVCKSIRVVTSLMYEKRATVLSVQQRT